MHSAQRRTHLATTQVGAFAGSCQSDRSLKSAIRLGLVVWCLLLVSLVRPLEAQSIYTPYHFSTLAGTVGGLGVADGAGEAARFYMPRAIAADGNGNVYVADSFNHTIRKITSAGVVTALAGAVGTNGSVDDTGAAARFRSPFGVAVDGNGNVFVADTNNSTIRRITLAGVVTTLAGTAGSTGNADGTGAAARFHFPFGVAVDGNGNVYVADTHSHTIRKITAGGEVTTLAGTAGSSGSADGMGAAARLNMPYGVAADVNGNVYVSEPFSYTIRKITATGLVTTLAGRAGISGIADGAGTEARFALPRGLAVDGNGNVYVADASGSTIRKIMPGSVVTTLAGSAASSGSVDGAGAAARFAFPSGVTVHENGSIYVADTVNSTIRKITREGVTMTLAGNAFFPGGADGTGATARFKGPNGVAVESNGNVYVADTNNHTIRKITVAGEVTTIAGTADSSGSVNGTGAAARFYIPFGVAADGNGNVYVADTGNSTIRKITPAGVVTTLAGTVGSPGNLDGRGAAAQFWGPRGVAVDGSGNVYVADSINHTIRKITGAGDVTTLAGLAGSRGSTDGIGAAARFNFPFSVAVDVAGNVYVADRDNSTIRKIAVDGVVTTLAGAASRSGSIDGTTGTADGMGAAARFYLPSGVAVDGSGNLYVADTENHRIRVGSAFKAPPTVTAQPASQTIDAGQNATLVVLANSSAPAAYQWTKDGTVVAGATNSTLAIANVQPANTGLYSVAIASGATTLSDVAIVGVTTSVKVLGAASEIGADIAHPNGNVFDQVLLQGAAATITADYAQNQITRMSYIDLSDDIVQVEFSGPGTLSLALDNPSGTATPVEYNQPGIAYMKGHAGIVITGATENTNVSVFTVGRATAFDPTGGYNILLPISPANNPTNNGSSLFQGHNATTYDGVADLAFIAISSANGKFGGVRTAGASYFAAKGHTGVYAPGVQFHGPLFIGDINASDTATAVLQVGSVSDARIAGGDLLQRNGQPVKISGIVQLKFTAGTTSQGITLSAQTCQAQLLRDGVDATWQIAVSPSP